MLCPRPDMTLLAGRVFSILEALLTDFDRFVSDLHAHATENPNVRVALGVDRDLGALPDPSLGGALRQVADARALLARLDTVPDEGLEFDARLDRDLARQILEFEVHDLTHTFNGRTRLEQMPRAGDEIGEPLFLLFVNDPRHAHDRLCDVTARLEGVPAYLEAMLGRLNTPVRRWVDIERQKVAALPSLLDTLVGWAETVGFADRERLAVARGEAERALVAYAERLAALPTTDGLHVGRETAERIVALRGIERSLDELHGMARDFLREVGDQVETLRGRLVQKHGLPGDTSVEALQEHLNRAYRVQLGDKGIEGVLDRYQQERERILAFIRARDLFPVPDDQDMLIIQTPPFMEPSIPAGAMTSPPPFREGVRMSMVFLTLSDDLLDEHTELSIPNMMIHEGIPGHHLQLSWAASHPSVVRRHADAMDLAEGWTTMLEDYMVDVGYGAELADELRFIAKRDIARIGARVGIDLFFMTGDRSFLDLGVDCDLSSDDPFEAAGNLLRAVTGFTAGRVQAELNWYSMERGYPLSYLTGNRLVWELKRDVQAANAGELDPLALDRRFHDVFLRAGNMPVAMLRRVFAHEGLL